MGSNGEEQCHQADRNDSSFHGFLLQSFENVLVWGLNASVTASQSVRLVGGGIIIGSSIFEKGMHYYLFSLGNPISRSVAAVESSS